MWLTAVSAHGQSLRGAPDGQEDAHANHSQLNKDALQESGLPEPDVSWVGTAHVHSVTCALQTPRSPRGKLGRIEQHIQMSGARGGGRWVKQRLKHLYSDIGKRCGEGREAPGPQCIPHRNKPASHDCNYKPSSSLGVNEAFGMMGKGRS